MHLYFCRQREIVQAKGRPESFQAVVPGAHENNSDKRTSGRGFGAGAGAGVRGGETGAEATPRARRSNLFPRNSPRARA